MMRLRALIAVPIVTMGGACTAPAGNGTVCTALFAYGISVSVIDSASGAAAGAGATVVASEGPYADSVVVPLTASPSFPIGLAGERAGTYLVTVRKSGYRNWRRSDVVVTKDECHVKGVAVTAKIQPVP